MKKILLFIILLCFSFYGFSQDEELKDSKETQSKGSTFQGVKFGIRGGLTISNLDFEDTPIIGNEHRNSFYIGFFADIGLSNTISLVPEIQFSPEGAKTEVLHLDYIQVPLLIMFKLSNKIHAGIGPQIGLKVNKVDDNANNMAYSGVAGVEYRINYALFVDARYAYGFRNVFVDNSGVSAKNRNVQIGVGYKF